LTRSGRCLNAFVNYNSYVPEKTMDNPAISRVLKRYEVRAKQEKVDLLGFYLPPFNYAIGQMLEQAVTARPRGLDQKVHGRVHPQQRDEDHVGNIRFDAWANGLRRACRWRSFRGSRPRTWTSSGL